MFWSWKQNCSLIIVQSHITEKSSVEINSGDVDANIGLEYPERNAAIWVTSQTRLCELEIYGGISMKRSGSRCVQAEYSGETPGQTNGLKRRRIGLFR